MKAAETDAARSDVLDFYRRLKAAWQEYSYRVPYCVPYWNAQTYRAILMCLATGRIVEGPRIDRVEQRLARLFSAGIRTYSKGRVALEVALRGLGVGRGDEVVLPSFCCTSVVLPVLALGATPILADVGTELNLTAESVDAVLTRHTRAIIVPHLFGNPADIEAIEGLAQGTKIRVIDDAAQAFGATSNGRLLGTFGASGLVSFGSGKVCFGTGGAALISRTDGWLDQAQSVALETKRLSREVGEVFKTLLWRRWRRRLLPLQVIIRRFKAAQKKEPGAPSGPYSREPMSNVQAAVVLTLLDTLDANLAARRERSLAYRKLLEKCPGFSLFHHREGSACLTQVVKIEPVANNVDRSSLIVSRLRSAGYEIKGSYIPIHLVPEYSGFAKRTPRFTDRVWPHLIELPCEPDVPLDEIERIVALMRLSRAA